MSKQPFGTLLGKTKEGIEAFSNANSSYISEQYIATGMKWQCVEFARRWLLKVKNIELPQVDFAYELWKLGERTTTPLPGNLLIYSKEYLGTGHVAVIVEVNEDSIKVAEQNYLNEKWPGSYARVIDFKNRKINDSSLLGIIRPY